MVVSFDKWLCISCDTSALLNKRCMRGPRGRYLNLFLGIFPPGEYRGSLHSGHWMRSLFAPQKIIQSLTQQSYSSTGTRRVLIRPLAVANVDGKLFPNGRMK